MTREVVLKCIWLISVVGLMACIEADAPLAPDLDQPLLENDGDLVSDLNQGPPPDPSVNTDPTQVDAPNMEGTAMSFEPPKITEEENFSIHIPNHLRCDSCHAVVYQISLGIVEFQADKRWGETKAPESDIAELFEELCERHRFENYGIKEVSGKNRLSGVGLPTADSPGMMQGGGKWPFRLSSMCMELTGELDEYFIYAAFLEAGPAGLETLQSMLCSAESYESTTSCINDRVEPFEDDHNHAEL